MYCHRLCVLLGQKEGSRGTSSVGQVYYRANLRKITLTLETRPAILIQAQRSLSGHEHNKGGVLWKGKVTIGLCGEGVQYKGVVVICLGLGLRIHKEFHVVRQERGRTMIRDYRGSCDYRPYRPMRIHGKL